MPISGIDQSKPGTLSFIILKSLVRHRDTSFINGRAHVRNRGSPNHLRQYHRKYYGSYYYYFPCSDLQLHNYDLMGTGLGSLLQAASIPSRK